VRATGSTPWLGVRERLARFERLATTCENAGRADSRSNPPLPADPTGRANAPVSGARRAQRSQGRHRSEPEIALVCQPAFDDETVAGVGAGVGECSHATCRSRAAE
jgi:hypothetical protein